MATRQYIGARYTPKFSGTYDTTQAYEALEVVDNGSGTTYIARKPVPPNTALTNTEYWLVYGSSSGAILDLQDRVSDIENTDLPAINQNITNINGSILTMGGQISALDGRIDTADSNINALGVRVSRLEEAAINPNLRVVVYSDSYGLIRDGITSFPEYMRSELMLSESNFFNLSQGSMGINPNSVITGGLAAWIDSTYTQVSNRETITDVLIAMGANDINNIEGIGSSYGTCVNKIRTRFPNAKIHLAFIGTTYSQTIPAKNEAFKAYMRLSAEYKTPFIQNSDLIMRDGTNLQADHVHPNATGADALGKGLAFGLINGFLHYSHADASASFTLCGSKGLQYNIYDNNVTIHANRTAGTSTQSITTDYTTADLSQSVIRGRGSGQIVAYTFTGSTIDPLRVILNNSKIYIATINGTVSFSGWVMPSITVSLRDNN